jgi:F-type H+-transporting ATPase subunit alpha
VELLKQGQYSPYPVEDVRRFESEFLQYLRHLPGGPLQAIRSEGDLSEASEQGLLQALNTFAESFTTSSGTILGREAEAKPMDEAAVGQEKVQVRRQPPPPKR